MVFHPVPGLPSELLLGVGEVYPAVAIVGHAVEDVKLQILGCLDEPDNISLATPDVLSADIRHPVLTYHPANSDSKTGHAMGVSEGSAKRLVENFA